MIVRAGTDLAAVSRVEDLVAAVGEPFLARTWTAAERAACGGRAESLAVRWAAKESVLKALGVGVDAIRMTDIEVVDGLDGPAVRLHGEAASRAARLGLTDWAVSLSHDGGMALAFVVALGDVTDR